MQMKINRENIQYCKRCGMPKTRPGSIFNKHGVCQACINFENRKHVEWRKRIDKLSGICDTYRKTDGSYDCIIPVSGGKDSYRIVYEIKYKFRMNPLLVTVGDHFTKTKAGAANFKNIGKEFHCDHITFDISPNTFIKTTKTGFEKLGEPLKFIEYVIYTMPLKIAAQMGISLVVFGENSSYEYGTTDTDNYSANETILSIFNTANPKFWIKEAGLTINDVNSIISPPHDQTIPQVIYMSHFMPWSSTKNLEIAKRYGFKELTHEWKREGYIEDFEQIDSKAYMIHLWMKYPKFGFQRTTDIATRRVREGLLTLEEAKKLIEENDHKIDSIAVDDFNKTLGYSMPEFMDIVDKYWNREIFDSEIKW